MKVDERGQPNLTPREERAVLDEIRNDHELIARLRITQFELEALSKCALMGTLTCKQDMLFLLREIREATSPAIDHPTLSDEPAPPDDPKEESVPELQRIPVRVAPAVMPEAASVEGIVRHRLPGQFGFLIWALAAAVAVVTLPWSRCCAGRATSRPRSDRQSARLPIRARGTAASTASTS